MEGGSVVEEKSINTQGLGRTRQAPDDGAVADCYTAIGIFFLWCGSWLVLKST
jgi:hypothetical protein